MLTPGYPTELERARVGIPCPKLEDQPKVVTAMGGAVNYLKGFTVDLELQDVRRVVCKSDVGNAPHKREFPRFIVLREAVEFCDEWCWGWERLLVIRRVDGLVA